LRGNKIGRIDLKGVYSFFEVENDAVEKVTQAFKKVEYNGRSVRIEMSQDGDKRRGGGGGRRDDGPRKRWHSTEGGSRGEKREYSGGGSRPPFKRKFNA